MTNPEMHAVHHQTLRKKAREVVHHLRNARTEKSPSPLYKRGNYSVFCGAPGEFRGYKKKELLHHEATKEYRRNLKLEIVKENWNKKMSSFIKETITNFVLNFVASW